MMDLVLLVIKEKAKVYGFGFFMYYILDNFIPICEEKGDIELANKYKMINLNLKRL